MPPFRPHFHRREINRAQHVPMGLKKRLPSGPPLSFGSPLDANGELCRGDDGGQLGQSLST